MTILTLCLFKNIVNAECTNEELNDIKYQVSKITVSYKHLGEVIKDDGSTVYNEFMVTANKVPEGIFIHLYPMTSENFESLDDNTIGIKLTTGSWKYDFYSSKCEEIVDSININLPTFNIYSLDPLCSEIDGNQFKLCGKYYEENVSREDFEQRLKLYKQLHVKEKKEKTDNNKLNIISVIVDFFVKYYLYILIPIIFILLVVLILKIAIKRKDKQLLQ